MLAVEVAEEQRDQVGPRPGRGSDRKPPVELTGTVLLQVGEQLLLRLKQALRGAVEPAAGLGRLDAPPGTVEQTPAEPLLERANLLADRGLCHPEPLGSEREALPLDDSAERRQLSGIEGHAISSPRRSTRAAWSVRRVIS